MWQLKLCGLNCNKAEPRGVIVPYNEFSWSYKLQLLMCFVLQWGKLYPIMNFLDPTNFTYLYVLFCFALHQPPKKENIFSPSQRKRERNQNKKFKVFFFFLNNNNNAPVFGRMPIQDFGSCLNCFQQWEVTTIGGWERLRILGSWCSRPGPTSTCEPHVFWESGFMESLHKIITCKIIYPIVGSFLFSG